MGLTYNYESTDTGAPTLNNAAGALITLLTAVLVNGFNTKTVTITRSGSTATANCTSHGYRTGQIIKHSGASQTEYNIEARVTVTDANNYTFTVSGTPATPATGTITAIVAPLGWTKPYTGTNLAAFRQKTGTNQFYLRVYDPAATEANLRGYEAMTAISTGTGPFPTVAQVAGNGQYLYKSPNSTNRPWKLWSDGKIFHFIVLTDVTTWTYSDGSAFSFGDFTSFKSGDAYNTVLMATPASGSYGSGCSWASVSAHVGSTTGGFYVARAASQTGGAYNAAKLCQAFFNVTYYVGYSTAAYPDPVTGGANISPVFVSNTTDANLGIRGYIPGLWGWQHSDEWAIGDTFSGATGTELAGRTFEQASPYPPCHACIETSDTWGL